MISKTLLPKKALRIPKSGLENPIQKFFKTAVLKNRKRGFGGVREKRITTGRQPEEKDGDAFLSEFEHSDRLAADLPPASSTTTKTFNVYFCFCGTELIRRLTSTTRTNSVSRDNILIKNMFTFVVRHLV